MTGGIVHIYTADHQEATYYDAGIPVGEELIFTNPDHRPLWTHCCGFKKRKRVNGKRVTVHPKRRWAKNCTVQVYYDEIRFWCKPGKGCRR